MCHFVDGANAATDVWISSSFRAPPFFLSNGIRTFDLGLTISVGATTTVCFDSFGTVDRNFATCIERLSFTAGRTTNDRTTPVAGVGPPAAPDCTGTDRAGTGSEVVATGTGLEAVTAAAADALLPIGSGAGGAAAAAAAEDGGAGAVPCRAM